MSETPRYDDGARPDRDPTAPVEDAGSTAGAGWPEPGTAERHPTWSAPQNPYGSVPPGSTGAPPPPPQNPYGSVPPGSTGPPPPPPQNPYAAPPPAPGSVSPYGTEYPPQGPQGSYGYGAPGAQAPYGALPYGQSQVRGNNGSAIALTVVSGALLLISCGGAFLAAVPGLVLGILGMTKYSTDPVGAVRMTRIGWIVFGAGLLVSLMALVGILALGFSSNGSSFRWGV
ncbi:hypothetical protein [Pedococcus sp. 5OH_020]|uniref:hypothetical protein n=1 Tax=Pedococcus sp. 5OH_020 TaxID=2989814 RepID=UPI0022E9E15A|nr:hypothetical protein [Pedococcus sp. 5OH_020]